MTPKKILIVASNLGTVGKNENGTYVVEIGYPFQYFIDNGYSIDIVTPKGGQAPIYPREYAGFDLGRIQRSELFVSKTNNSISAKDLKDTAYVAVFYPGGYGQFFDVVKDENILPIVAKIYERGGVIGTTGHGTASLVNIKLSNNNYLVDGKTLTCFPHWAEVPITHWSNYGKLLPFDMEEVLVKKCANLIPYLKGGKQGLGLTTIVDDKNRIVTGAFASDAKLVAKEMVKLLKLTTKYADTGKKTE